MRHDLTTTDGERLAAVHVSGPGAVALVVVHGFTGSLTKPYVERVVAGLSRHAPAIAFELRGHGRSTGRSSLGDSEVYDVDAAVRWARVLGYDRVVVVGWSMGAAAAIRHAALLGGGDGVVAVSTMARWPEPGRDDGFDAGRLQWVRRLVTNPLGRLLTRTFLHTRVGSHWPPPAPIDVVAQVAPTPLLLVHGAADRHLAIAHAHALAAAAGPSTPLWVVPGYGHAEAAADDALLAELARRATVSQAPES